jgi:hypothetical protein
VLGGLTLSTGLSLLVVPSFYVIADRMKNRVFSRAPVQAPSPTG